MEIKQIIKEGYGINSLRSSVAEQVFDEIASVFVEKGTLPSDSREALRDAFVEREHQGTTAFVPGFAVPHVFLDQVTKPQILIARHETGFDMNSLDGQPTTMLICIVAAEAHRETYLELLKFVATVTRDRRYRRLMEQSPEATDVLEVLLEAEVS